MDMMDREREKVIKDLEFCVNGHFKVELSLATKILALLKEQQNEIWEYQELNEYLQDKVKEQEAVEPVDDGHGSLICGNQGYECGCVGRYDLATKEVEKYCNFCPECGRKVKWK